MSKKKKNKNKNPSLGAPSPPVQTPNEATSSNIAPEIEKISKIPVLDELLPPPTSHQKIWGGAIGCFLYAMILYLLTMARSLPGGDSGELSYVACSWGIAHPPGYPLWTMLANLINLIPISTPVFRSGLLSALPTALAGVLIYGFIFNLTKHWIASLFSGLIFVSSALVWRYAIVPEVFGLHVLIVASLLYFFERFCQDTSRPIHWTMAIFITLGLGVAHHQTIIFFGGPVVFFWVFLNLQRQQFTPQMILIAGACGALGCLPYLYLPLSAQTLKLTQWGDFSDVDGFLRHFLRRDYGTFKLTTGNNQSSLVYNNRFFLTMFFKDALWIGVLPLALGVFSFWSNRPEIQTLKKALLLCFALYALVFFSMANMPRAYELHKEVLQRFFLQPEVLLFIFLGIGLTQLPKFFEKNLKIVLNDQALISLLSFVVVALVLVNFRHLNRSSRNYIERYGYDFLAILPKDALFLINGDIVHNSVGYLKNCKQERPDLRVVNRTILRSPGMEKRVRALLPEVILPDNPKNLIGSGTLSLKELFDLNYNKFALYTTRVDSGSWEDKQRPEWSKDYRLMPEGLLYRVYKYADIPKYQDYVKRIEELKLEDYFDRMPAGFALTEWEYYVRNDYLYSAFDVADTLIRRYGEVGVNKDAIIRAAKILHRVEKIYPDPFPDLYKDLAMCYRWLLDSNPKYTIPLGQAAVKLMQLKESGKFAADFADQTEWGQHKAVHDYYKPKMEACLRKLETREPNIPPECQWDDKI